MCYNVYSIQLGFYVAKHAGKTIFKWIIIF